MNFFYLSIFRKCIRKIQAFLNVARITGTLHEDPRTFVISG
jgi:hypothetical protein